jgi:hypothetical protein
LGGVNFGANPSIDSTHNPLGLGCYSSSMKTYHYLPSSFSFTATIEL